MPRSLSRPAHAQDRIDQEWPDSLDGCCCYETPFVVDLQGYRQLWPFNRSDLPDNHIKVVTPREIRTTTYTGSHGLAEARAVCIRQRQTQVQGTRGTQTGELAMNGYKINHVLVGKALVGEGNEVAQVDLVMGPRGSAAEAAFCNALTNQKGGTTRCWLWWPPI